MDDGGDLVNTLHAERPDLLAGVRGGCESTSTGVARLRRMAAAGSLAFPVVAADASATRRLIDHTYGTGQSVIDGVIRATHTLLAGKTVVVAGFGPCGSGIAERARGLGAQVIVTEVDPVARPGRDHARLPGPAHGGRGQRRRAVHHGHRVARRHRARPTWRSCATGRSWPTRATSTWRSTSARWPSWRSRLNPAVRPHADEYVLADGRRLILLAEGRVVNLVAAEGSPPAAMDVSFAVQALALAWLASGEAMPAPGVHAVPAAIDTQVAGLALAALGAEIDVADRGPAGVPGVLAPGQLTAPC